MKRTSKLRKATSNSKVNAEDKLSKTKPTNTRSLLSRFKSTSYQSKGHSSSVRDREDMSNLNEERLKRAARPEKQAQIEAQRLAGAKSSKKRKGNYKSSTGYGSIRTSIKGASRPKKRSSRLTINTAFNMTTAKTKTLKKNGSLKKLNKIKINDRKDEANLPNVKNINTPDLVA